MDNRRAILVDAFLQLAKKMEKLSAASADAVTSAILTAAFCRAMDDDLTKAKATMRCPAARSQLRSCCRKDEGAKARTISGRPTNCFRRSYE